MDTYCECLFKKKRTLKDNIVAAVIIFAALILLRYSILLLRFPSVIFLAPTVWFGIIWGSFKLIKRQNQEYEYLLTGGDLDVDVVIAKSSRKRLFSIRRREIEFVSHISNDKIKEIDPNLPVTDVTSGYNPEAVYVIKTSQSSKTPVIYFEPSEKMLEQLKSKIPGKFFE